jgi:hypothetical protein
MSALLDGVFLNNTAHAQEWQARVTTLWSNGSF